MHFFFLLLFSLFCSFGYSQEPVEIHPIDLPFNWWEHLKKDLESAAGKEDLFLSHLQEIVSKFSEENKKISSNYIEKIRTNLQAYREAEKYIYPPIPKAKPFKSQYFLADLVEINHNLRQRENELKAVQDDIKDKKSFIKASENFLNQLIQKYNRAEDRSENKVLLGLQIIAHKIGIEVAKEEVRYFERLAEIHKIVIAQLEEEATFALSHIVVTNEELLITEAEVKAAEEQLKEARQIQEAKESEAILTFTKTPTDKSTAENLILVQELIQAGIEAAKAENQFIFLSVKLAFAVVILEPQKVDFTELHLQVNSWFKQLENLQNQIRDWTATSQRHIQRSGEILAIADPTQSKPTEILHRRIISLAQSSLVSIQKLSNDVDDSLFLLEGLNKKITTLLGVSSRWFLNIAEFTSKIFSRSADWLSTTLFHIGSTPFTPMSIIKFLGIIIATIWISRLILATLMQIAQRRRGIRKSLLYRVNRLIHYSILIIGIIIALSAIGFDFSTLILITGALGVGLGFGLQSIFNNFISGIILLFESNLKVGDYIELGTNLKGEIRTINVRSTVITTNDGGEIIVPNSEMINSRIINWTLSDPFKRHTIPFVVAYGSDKDLVEKIVVDAAMQIPFTLASPVKPDPAVFLVKLGDYGMEYELIVWVNERMSRKGHSTVSDYLYAIENTLREHKVKIPFPLRDVHIVK